MKIKPLYYLHFWSLDIVLGVVAGSIFAASVFVHLLPVSYFIIIALSTWIIYFTDHIIDGIKAGPEAPNPVRRTFYRYKIPFILLTFIIAVFDFRFILYVLNPDVIRYGFVLLMATAVYFMLQLFYGSSYKLFFIKELWVAIIYTLAIWGGPIIYSGRDIGFSEISMIIVFGLLVLSNVLSFSFYEIGEDRNQHKKTFATDFGAGATRKAMLIINLLALFVLLASIIFTGARFSFLHYAILFLMTAGLMSLYLWPAFFNVGRRYGLMAEGVFVLPLLVVVL